MLWTELLKHQQAFRSPFEFSSSLAVGNFYPNLSGYKGSVFCVCGGVVSLSFVFISFLFFLKVPTVSLKHQLAISLCLLGGFGIVADDFFSSTSTCLGGKLRRTQGLTCQMQEKMQENMLRSGQVFLHCVFCLKLFLHYSNRRFLNECPTRTWLEEGWWLTYQSLARRKGGTPWSTPPLQHDRTVKAS